jgi:hypothetical protein
VDHLGNFECNWCFNVQLYLTLLRWQLSTVTFKGLLVSLYNAAKRWFRSLLTWIDIVISGKNGLPAGGGFWSHSGQIPLANISLNFVKVELKSWAMEKSYLLSSLFFHWKNDKLNCLSSKRNKGFIFILRTRRSTSNSTEKIVTHTAYSWFHRASRHSKVSVSAQVMSSTSSIPWIVLHEIRSCIK